MTFYGFFKFCERQWYANDFVSGRPWMNPVGYFKKLESGPAQRDDRYEGLIGWHQPSGLSTIEIGDIVIPAADLAAPLIIEAAHAEVLNVLSLYTVRRKELKCVSRRCLEHCCRSACP